MTRFGLFWAQVKCGASAARHKFVELMYARLPVDHWVGVNTHKLNQLWCGGDSREFSAWLSKPGKVFVAHECESEHLAGVF